MFSSYQDFEYRGSELELFAEAVNWRIYWQRQATPFLGRNVLEVGAGIGTITRDLCRAPVERWVALEPDPKMAARLGAERRAGRLPPACEPLCGTIAMLGPEERFDTVIYIDVLEHIEDDREALRRMSAILQPGGVIVLLVPAFPALYGPIDKQLGHHRRYTRKSLRKLAAAAGLHVKSAHYMNAIGFFGWWINAHLLRREAQSASQIGIFDRYIVPLSSRLEGLVPPPFGQSLLAVRR